MKQKETVSTEIKEKIKDFFWKNDLPTPVTISLIGEWAHGTRYAVTCGIIRLRKYCVYTDTAGDIVSVRQRDKKGGVL